MFKKINQYLITQYPLVWNLKLVWIFLVGIALNLIAFVHGYFNFRYQSQLLEYNNFDDFYQDRFVIYYFLVAILILIYWVYNYIKNNRFKSKYPTSRNYLFKEFIAIFGILLLFMLIPHMFKFGFTKHIASDISDEQFAKDVDLINRVAPFTLQVENGYSNVSRNLSVPVFDNLVSEEEVKSLFNQKKQVYLKQYPHQSYNAYLQPYFRNDEYNELLFHKIPAIQETYSGIEFNSSYTSYDDSLIENQITYTNPDSKLAAVETYGYSGNDISTKDIFTIYSLYNYSQIKFKVPNRPEFTHQYYDEQLIKILQNNDRSKIEELITSYKKLLDKYKIGSRFNEKKWIDYIPKPPYFFVTQELQNAYYYDGVKEQPKDYVNAQSIQTIYSNYQKAKYNPEIFNSFEVIITIALVITVVIITFRFSSFKVWLISQIGIGILFVFGFFFGMIFSTLGLENYMEYYIVIGFYLIFLILIIIGFSKNQNKIITGVCLNWFVYLSIFIILLIINFYKEVKVDYISQKNKVNVYEVYEYPDIKAIEMFTELYLFFNPILYIIFFYFVINWYRKWQAMAEE